MSDDRLWTTRQDGRVRECHRAGGCDGCGHALYFSERVAWPQAFCFACATVRGIVRLSDRTRLHNLQFAAARVPPWWSWTVYLGHVAQWRMMHPTRTAPPPPVQLDERAELRERLTRMWRGDD